MEESRAAEIKAYQEKFYVTTKHDDGATVTETPHGRFVYNSQGQVISHTPYALDDCRKAGDKKHKWDGIELDNGFGPAPTCSLCGCNYATYLMHTGE